MDYLETALIGLHSAGIKRMLSMQLELLGYQVTESSSVDEMKEIMNISSQGVPQNLFGLYLMDINLGTRGGYTYDPISQIYTPLKPTLNEKSTIIGISGNLDTVIAAKQAGIPNCFLNTDIGRLFSVIDDHKKLISPSSTLNN